MKLSDLVKLRRTIQNIYPSDYEYPLQTSLNNLIDTFEAKGNVAKMCVADIKFAQENISNEFASIRQHLRDYDNYLLSCIQEREKEYYELGNQIYQNSLNDDAKYILTRRKESLTFADEDNKKLFTSRIGLYQSWKFPCIEIRPAFGEITEYLKGCDPLYLLDTDEGLFSEVKKKWNTMYQRRLRYYTFKESRNHPLHELPDEQFGLICSVDYFNFKPMSIIKNMLNEFYLKLRPGGVTVFTYNNCDMPYAIRNVENQFCCYTPGTAIINFATEIGFEVVKNVDRLENISWLELRKPGEFSSIKGGQTVGEIRNFSSPE